MSRLIKASMFAVVAMSLVQVVQAASGAKFVVDQGDESKVQFISDAPLEKISGVGHKLTGNVEFEPTQLTKGKGSIELDVASIRTGVDLRDDHLKSDAWLDAKKYPKIKFDITKVEGANTIAMGQAVDLKVTGKLSMHGVTREETATAKVRMTDKGLKVQANFKVNLTNYKVSVPQVVRLKVSDEIQLNIMLGVKPKR